MRSSPTCLPGLCGSLGKSQSAEAVPGHAGRGALADSWQWRPGPELPQLPGSPFSYPSPSPSRQRGPPRTPGRDFSFTPTFPSLGAPTSACLPPSQLAGVMIGLAPWPPRCSWRQALPLPLPLPCPWRCLYPSCGPSHGPPPSCHLCCLLHWPPAHPHQEEAGPARRSASCAHLGWAFGPTARRAALGRDLLLLPGQPQTPVFPSTHDPRTVTLDFRNAGNPSPTTLAPSAPPPHLHHLLGHQAAL